MWLSVCLLVCLFARPTSNLVSFKRIRGTTPKPSHQGLLDSRILFRFPRSHSHPCISHPSFLYLAHFFYLQLAKDGDEIYIFNWLPTSGFEFGRDIWIKVCSNLAHRNWNQSIKLFWCRQLESNRAVKSPRECKSWQRTKRFDICLPEVQLKPTQMDQTSDLEAPIWHELT